MTRVINKQQFLLSVQISWNYKDARGLAAEERDEDLRTTHLVARNERTDIIHF